VLNVKIACVGIHQLLHPHLICGKINGRNFLSRNWTDLSSSQKYTCVSTHSLKSVCD